ncbi:hypothetical protein J4453_03725 [Candidatus Woesearchaeota archaeon]|nr:hypothetical protein [Candidatus Woesearchaeota archaeon]
MYELHTPSYGPFESGGGRLPLSERTRVSDRNDGQSGILKIVTRQFDMFLGEREGESYVGLVPHVVGLEGDVEALKRYYRGQEALPAVLRRNQVKVAIPIEDLRSADNWIERAKTQGYLF